MFAAISLEYLWALASTRWTRRNASVPELSGVE